MLFETLATFVQPWSDYYAANATAATVVLATHVLSMFVAGGVAIAADRAIVRAAPGSAEAARAVVADLATTHSVVITALSITMASGAALFLSDVANFASSNVYWIKMGTLVLLLSNGWRMRRAERLVMHPLANLPLHTTEMPIAFPQRAWSAVRSAATASLLLWCAMVLLGVFLSNGS